MRRLGALAVGLVLATFPTAQAATPGPGYDIEMSRMIPMRDGIELEAWTKARVAHIQIFHDGRRASVLQLPLAAAPAAPH